MADEILNNQKEEEQEQSPVTSETTPKPKQVRVDTGRTPKSLLESANRTFTKARALEDWQKNNPDKASGSVKIDPAKQNKLEAKLAQENANYWNFNLKDAAVAAPSGVNKAIGSTFDLGSALGRQMGAGNVPRITEQPWYPSTAPRKSVYGDVIEMATQFLVPFLGIGKINTAIRGKAALSGADTFDEVLSFAGRKMSKTQKDRILKNRGAGLAYEAGATLSRGAEFTVRSGVVDMTAFDPAYGNLSNFISDLQRQANLQNRLEDATKLQLLSDALKIDIENFDPDSLEDRLTAGGKMAVEGALLGGTLGTVFQIVQMGRFKTAAHWYGKKLQEYQNVWKENPNAWTAKQKTQYAKTLAKVFDLEERAFNSGVSVVENTRHLTEGHSNHAVSNILSPVIATGDDTLFSGPLSAVRKDNSVQESFEFITSKIENEGAAYKILGDDDESVQILAEKGAKQKADGKPIRRVPAFIQYLPDGTNRIVLDPNQIDASFKNAAWEKPKIDKVFPLSAVLKLLVKDGKLKSDLANSIIKGDQPIFKHKEDWTEFLVEHELSHHRANKRGTKFKNQHTKENATNMEALLNFLERRSGKSLEALTEGRKVHNVEIASDHGTLYKVQNGEIILDEAAIKADYEDLKFIRGTSTLDGSYNEAAVFDKLGVSTLGLKHALDKVGGADAYVRFLGARAKLLAEAVDARKGDIPSLATQEGMGIMMKATKEALLDKNKGLGLNERSISQTLNNKLNDSFDISNVPFKTEEVYKDSVTGPEEFGKYVSGIKKIRGADGKMRNFTMKEAIADMRKKGLFNPDTLFNSNHSTNKSIATVYKLWEDHFAAQVGKTTKKEELIKILGLKNLIQEGGDVNSALAKQNEIAIEELSAALRVEPDVLKNQLLEGRGVFDGTFEKGSNTSTHPLLNGDVETLHLRLGAYRLVIEENAAKIAEVAKKMRKLHGSNKEAAYGSPEGIELANEYVALKNALREDMTAVQKTRRSWGLAGQSLQRDLGKLTKMDGTPMFKEEDLLRMNLEILENAEGGVKKIFEQAETVHVKNELDGTLDDGLAILDSVNKAGVSNMIFGALVDWRVNSMLGSFKTQGVNIAGTSLRTYQSVLSKYIGTRDWPLIGNTNFNRYKKYSDIETKEDMVDYGNAYSAAMFANLNEMYLSGLKMMVNYGVPENVGRQGQAAGKLPINRGGVSERDVRDTIEASAISGKDRSSVLETGSDNTNLNEGGRGVGTFDSADESKLNSETLVNIARGFPGDSRYKPMKTALDAAGVGKGGKMDDVLLGFDNIVGATLGWAMRGMVTVDEYIKQAYYRSHLKASILADMTTKGEMNPANNEQLAKKLYWIGEYGSLENGQYFNIAGLYQQAARIHPDDPKSQHEYVRIRQKRIEEHTGFSLEKLEDLTKGAFQRAKEVAWQRRSTQNIEDIQKSGDTDSLVSQGPYAYGKLTQNVQNIGYGHNAFGVFVTPFILTPVNIAKFVGQHTFPLDYPLLRQAHQGMSANLLSGEADRIADQNGKFWLGTAMWGLGTAAGVSGFATGYGPNNREENKVWRETNEQFSIRTPDGGFVSYNRMDPYSWFVAIPAAISEGMRNARSKEEELRYQEYAMVWGVALSKAAGEKTYLKDIHNFLSIPFDLEKNAESYAQQLTASFVPSLMKDVGKGLNPVFTEARNYIDRLHQGHTGMPFFFEELGKADLEAVNENDPRKKGKQGRKEYAFRTKNYIPPSRNILGEARYKRGESHWQLAQSIFNPATYQPKNLDPIARELTSLMYDSAMPKPRLDGAENLDRTAAFAKVQNQDKETILKAKTLGIKEGQDLYDYWMQLTSEIRLGPKDLSGKTYNMKRMNAKGDWVPELEGKSGKSLRKALLELMASEKYQNEPVYTNRSSGEESKRIAMIDMVLTQYRDAAWDLIVGEPKLKQETDELGVKTQYVTGYTGVMGEFWPYYELNYLIHKGNSEVDQAGERNESQIRDVLDILDSKQSIKDLFKNKKKD